MGHPSMSSSFDDDGDDYEEEEEEEEEDDEDDEVHDGDDDEEDDDEEEEEDDEEANDEDGFNWSMHLPVRLAPLLVTLQKIRNGQETTPTTSPITMTTTDASSVTNGMVSIRQLHQMVASQRIFEDEVLSTVGLSALPANTPYQSTLYYTLEILYNATPWNLHHILLTYPTNTPVTHPIDTSYHHTCNPSPLFSD